MIASGMLSYLRASFVCKLVNDGVIELLKPFHVIADLVF